MVVSPSIKLEWYSMYPVEHQIRALPPNSISSAGFIRGPVKGTNRHVRDVRQRPARFLRHSWDGIVENLQHGNDDDVYRPSSYRAPGQPAVSIQFIILCPEMLGQPTLAVNPGCVQIRQGSLIRSLLNALWWFLVD